MKLRVCPGCKAIHDTTARGSRAGRCPTCSRLRDRERGTPETRGYDAQHRAARKAWAARLATGEVIPCWRCGDVIERGDEWDLGHDDHDRSITRGPEHARCNRSAAGRASRGG